MRAASSITVETPLSTAHRRHCHLVAAAGAAIDFLAGAELQVLAHADPHFAEPRLVAGHGDRGSAQAGIDLDEGVLDFGGADGLRAPQFPILFRNFLRGTRLAEW